MTLVFKCPSCCGLSAHTRGSRKRGGRRRRRRERGGGRCAEEEEEETTSKRRKKVLFKADAGNGSVRPYVAIENLPFF